MRNKKKSPNGKRASSNTKAASASKPKADPEWDVLEERFATMSTDFSMLADMAEKH